MSDKEGLTKQEIADNVKPETLINNVPKIDSGTSSESMSSDSTSDFKPKIDKNKNENDKVKDKTKKEKIILNTKVKVDLDKSKEKPKIEKIKDKVNDEFDDVKDKKKRLKDKNGNPFLRIIGEMTDEKPNESNLIENDYSTISKNPSRRKQNLKNLSPGGKVMKLKLSNDSKKVVSDVISGTDTKKEPRPLPLPAPKPKLPESKTILDKKNYSINIEKKEYTGEKKPTVKTFKSKFRSTGLEEQPPPPPPKSKVQSKKSTKTLAPLSLSKAEKRSLSPPSDSPIEKKPKNSPSESKKPTRKIFYLYLNIFVLLVDS